MKLTIPSYQLVTSGAMSGNFTSNAQNVQNLDNIGVQINFSGSASGSFYVDVSADHREDSTGNIVAAGHWIPLTFNSGTPTAAGVDDQIYLDLTEISSPYIRVRFVQTGGTGNMDVFITAKQV